MTIIAREPRQHAGAQERRFAGAGSAQDDEEVLVAAVAHAAQGVDAAQDLDVAAEEDCRVARFERLQATIG